jgi:hypothetical protein
METLRRTLQNTLELLDEGGVLGHATVFVLADHGPRGDGVPPSLTNNVMFVMFLQGERTSSIVTVPVSLVDIAPTVRHAVGLPDVATDGRLLPGVDAGGDPHREVQRMTAKPISVLDSLGIAKQSISASELAKFGRLNPDGTFDYTPEFMAMVRRLQPSASPVSATETPR